MNSSFFRDIYVDTSCIRIHTAILLLLCSKYNLLHLFEMTIQSKQVNKKMNIKMKFIVISSRQRQYRNIILKDKMINKYNNDE